MVLLMIRVLASATCAAVLTLGPAQVHAQTLDDWVEWGDRVHGGFGSLIALGIRIGLDALQRLGAQRREVRVDYTDGPQTPCACVLDGIAIAVSASLGQGTLALAGARTEPGLLARIDLWHRSTGQGLRYEIPADVLGLMQAINSREDAIGRMRAVTEIDAALLFRVTDSTALR